MAEKKGIVNLYGIIGVDEDAEEATIKKSYRQLVLKWHPDKNRAERQKAEEQIRLINAAYATLSNPAKRERYDLQRWALEKRRKGMMPKPKVSQKITAPKEFMMQPMGYPDKFVRCVEKKVVVQGRSDASTATFDEFFQQTKLSLWWVPDVNNCCRIRNLGSKAKGDKKAAAAGLAGGLNFSYRAKVGHESEIVLTPANKGQKSEIVDFVVKASPELEGAVRFETAKRRGFYLTFLPPRDLRVVSLLNDQPGRVLDFELVDFSASLKFKDIEEVLFPVGATTPNNWVNMSEFINSKEVQEYFAKVLQKPLWEEEDFATFFEGHWVDWEYNASDQTARLRHPEERLGQMLRSTANHGDAIMAVGRAGDELRKMPLLGALRAVELLTDGPGAPGTQEGKPDAPPPTVQETAVCRKLLQSLKSILSTVPREALADVEMSDLLDTVERVPRLVGEKPTRDELDQRAEAIQLLTQLIVGKVMPPEEAGTDQPGELKPLCELEPEDLARLLHLPGLTVTEEAQLVASVGPSLVGADLSTLCDVVQAATMRNFQELRQTATAAAVAGLEGLEPDEALKGVADLAEAGAKVAALAEAVVGRTAEGSTKLLGHALRALCSSATATAADAASCLQTLAQAVASRAPLELPEEMLLPLAVAVAKVPAAGAAFSAIVQATVAASSSWPVDDFMTLLLAGAKGRAQLNQEALSCLQAQAESVLLPQLADLKGADVVKLALGISSHGASKLLEATAKEVVIRLPDFAATQVLLATQALAQGLDSDHECLVQIMNFWPELLERAEKNPAPVGPGQAAARGQLGPEQVVKLATVLCPVLTAAGDGGRKQKAVCQKLAHALGTQLLKVAERVPEAVRRPLASFLHVEGPFKSFNKRTNLRTEILRKPKRRDGDSDVEQDPATDLVTAASRAKKKRRKQR